MSELCDLYVLAKRRSMRVAPNGIRSLARYMGAQGFITSADERVDQDWVELHLGPGESAHNMFRPGPADHEGPAPFRELTIYFGAEGVELAGDRVHFYIAVRGTPFGRLTEDMLDRIHGILWCHPEMLIGPHRGLAERRKPGEPPTEKLRPTDRSSGRTGTHVEEI